MRKLVLLALLLIAPLAWGQQPRVIITTATNDITATGSSLNVNCTGGCAAAGDNTTTSTPLGAANATIAVALAGERGAAFELAAGGTLVGTITPKCNFNGTSTFLATDQTGYLEDPVTGAVTTSATVASAQALTDYVVMCPQGASHAKLVVTAYTSGTANFVGRSTVATWPGIGWGVVTTSAPGYSTGLIAPVSLNTSGGLRVDGSGVTQPVSLASTTITGTVAVTQSGTWTVQPGNTQNTTAWLVTGAPSAASAGAASIFYNQAVTTEQTVKASAGNLYGLDVYNPNSSVCYLQIFNTTSATLGTTTPILSIPVTNGVATFWAPGPIGVANFSTAIGVASTTGAQNATTCTTGMTVNVWYN